MKTCSCKTCALRGVPQPLDAFSVSKYTTDGREYYCRVCKRASVARGRAAKRAKYDAQVPPGATNAPAAAPVPAEPPATASAPEALPEFEIDVVDVPTPAPTPADLKAAAEESARLARLQSDHAPLKAADLDPYKAPEYNREKKQEYNQNMGEFARTMRTVLEDPASVDEATLEKMAGFVSLTSEQERRWLNKRSARSFAIGTARELLMARQFEDIASRVQWPSQLAGYSARVKHGATRRMQTLALSDLHFGAGMPGSENPVAFDFVTAGRRLARLVLEQANMKTQYRDHTTLNLGLNGDIIEGLLQHGGDRDNAPLAEQMVAAGHFMFSAVQYLAQAFPRVEVWCEPGNHGRNKLVHPGRATSSKWDSYETVIYQFVRRQCASLPNVTFHIPKAPALVIPLFDHNALMTHGDSELSLKSPSSSGGKKSWSDALAFANTPRTLESGSPLQYGAPIHAVIAGHFHDPVVFPTPHGWAIAQSALVPANGFARGLGATTVCGMWSFESVPGYAVGDMRFHHVGPKDDVDASLDAVIPPFVWD